LENAHIPPDRVRDPFGRNMPGTGEDRDPERAPMPWDGSRNAGFTTGEPWLPLGDDHTTRNVEVQKGDSGSMLALTRALLDLRRREPALSLGDWAPLAVEGDVLAYVRSREDRRFAVVLNLAPAPKSARFGEDLGGRIILSTHPGRLGSPVHDRAELSADEAVIVAIGDGTCDR